MRAVVFDLGGVVLDSPFDVIASAEAASGLPDGVFNQIAAASGGAWGLHETGAIGRDEFITRMEGECAARGGHIDARRLLDDIENYARPRPIMLEAVATLRRRGFIVAALTNNWESPEADWDAREFQQLFDVFVESWVEGVRKPDPAIYLRLLDRLDLPAHECVFLDDIGRNLKTARDLGMHTIKVESAEQCLAELGELLGVDLGYRSPKA